MHAERTREAAEKKTKEKWVREGGRKDTRAPTAIR